jgi:hypothetical protein
LAAVLPQPAERQARPLVPDAALVPQLAVDMEPVAESPALAVAPPAGFAAQREQPQEPGRYCLALPPRSLLQLLAPLAQPHLAVKDVEPA